MDYKDPKATRMWHPRIQRDEKFRDDHLWSMDQMVAAAHGPHYSKRATAAYMPYNHYHSYTSLMVAQLMYDNPRTRVTTRRPGSQRQTAKALKHGLNRWVRDENLRRVGQQVAQDFCYTWGVLCVSRKPVRWEGETEERALWDSKGKAVKRVMDAMWPTVYRIPQKLFFADSTALTFDAAEYMGHKWFADLDDLLATARAKNEEGWKIDVLNRLADSGAAPDGEAESVDPMRRQRGEKGNDRDKVELVTVWVAGYQCDESKGVQEGYHGSLLVFAKCSSGPQNTEWTLAREPEPFYGPATGPYVVFGAYQLPNRMWPLSPLVAVEAQIRSVNRQARANEKSNEQHKRVILYNQRDTKAAAALQRARHHTFIGIPGFDKAKFVEAEFGGASDTANTALALGIDLLQRNSALGDAQQGRATGEATARENVIAADSTQTRISYLRQQFGDAMSRVLRTVAWYLYHDTTVVFPLGEEAALEFDMEEPWFHGGLHDKASDATFEDLELEIEAFSMQRMSHGEYANAVDQAVMGYLLPSLPLRMQFPFAGWSRLDELMGERYGLADLELMVDNAAAAEMQVFEAPQTEPQPRLSKDVGSGDGLGPVAPRRPGPRGPMHDAQMAASGRAQGGGNTQRSVAAGSALGAL